MNKIANDDGTVGKALLVLDLVATFDKGARFNEILAQSPFPKATTYRFLQTLLSQNMLSYDEETQKYRLGLRLVRLAHSAWTMTSLAPLARDILDQVSKDTSETIHLAQLDNAQVLYVDKRNAVRPITMFSNAGKIGPAYCTGVGKAMLAFLPDEKRDACIAQQSFYAHTDSTITNRQALIAELNEIRNRGYAFDNEEHESGIICIAIAILSDIGDVLGGLSITSSTERKTLEELRDYYPKLHDAAKQIAKAAEIWQHPK